MQTHTDNTSHIRDFFKQSIIFILSLILCLYGTSLKIFGLSLRPEKVIVAISFLAMSAFFILRGLRFRLERSEIILICWLSLCLISSISSSNPTAALRHTFDLGLSVSIFFVATALRPESISMTPTWPILKAGLLFGLGSIIVALTYFNGFPLDPSWVSDFVMVEKNLARIKMTMLEANLFGAVMMVFSLISIAELRKNNIYSWFYALFCHAGLLLAYSRGPIVGYLIGLLVYFHLLKYHRIKRILLLFLVLIISFSIMYISLTATGAVEQSKYMRYSTIIPRLITIQVAREDIMSSPILGNGSYSFEFLHPELSVVSGTGEEVSAWIGLMPVAVLHDTGILGFALFFGFFIYILRNGYIAVKQITQSLLRHAVARRVAAFLGSAVGMLVIAMTTATYSLAAFWVVMAIVSSIPKVHDLVMVNSEK